MSKSKTIIILLSSFIVVLFAATLVVFKDNIFSFSNKNLELKITYPCDSSLFPPEIASPTIVWTDSTPNVNNWAISVDVTGSGNIIATETTARSWRPDKDIWKKIKEFKEKDIKLSISGFNIKDKKVQLSHDEVTIRISKDSVNAPIFFRDIILDPGNPSTFTWRLVNVASDSIAYLVIGTRPTCSGCHSFSSNGKKFGMVMDFMTSNRRKYVFSDVEENMKVDYKYKNILCWYDLDTMISPNPGVGYMPKISHDGNYIVSSINQMVIISKMKYSLKYNQNFYPIRGILAYYNVKEKKYYKLNGACDENFIQCNANLSPDDKYVIFLRSPLVDLPGDMKPIESRKDDSLFIAKNHIQYDIYRIPFNNGQGGTPEPLLGASNNGMSNYNPRYSPDGKWIVFNKSKYFQMMQPDSRLYIMPANGGTPRLMKCNTAEFNSWHSWSPNGKWMVFASKINGPYTQLFLTHIDENGNDTPPILLEYILPPNRAANLPEFVNMDPNKKLNLILEIEKTEIKNSQNMNNDMYQQNNQNNQQNNQQNRQNQNNQQQNQQNQQNQQQNPQIMQYIQQGQQNMDKRNFKGAIDAYTKVIKLDPNFIPAYVQRGYAKVSNNDNNGALADFNKALKINPRFDMALVGRATVKLNTNDLKGALTDINSALKISPNLQEAFFVRGQINFKAGDKKQACIDWKQAASLGYRQANDLIKQNCK